jgi:hypothetical protein
MNRPIPWPWLLLALVLLLPSPAGRFLLDLVGGLTLTLLLLPLLAGVAGLIGWQILRQRLRTCPSCGAVSFGASACPACGAAADLEVRSPGWGRDPGPIDPRTATITIEAVDVPSGRSSPGAAVDSPGATPGSPGAGSEGGLPTGGH